MDEASAGWDPAAGRRRRRWPWALLAAPAIALAAYGVAHPSVKVAVTGAQVQERVDRRLPVEGRHLGVSYSVAPLAVTLRPDGRVGVAGTVRASALGRSGAFEVEGLGTPEYRDGSFYVGGLRITRLARAGAQPPAGEDASARGAMASQVREAATAALATGFASKPVYTLRQDDFRQSLARLALRDVRVEDGRLIATLDVMTALGRVLLWACVGLLALVMAVGLLLSPAGGLALAFGALS